MVHNDYFKEPDILTCFQTGENGDYQSDYHFEAALDKKEAILSLGDARSLTYLLLLAQQCLRTPKNLGAW